MSRPALVFAGSCVLGPVQDAFARAPSITARFDVEGMIYGREPSAPDVVARAAGIVIQDRMLAKPMISDETRKRYGLGDDACVVRVPNLTLAALWPLMCPDPRDRREVLSPFRVAQTDRLAVDVMRLTADPVERRSRYFATDVRSVVDLDRLHEMHAAQMRVHERECDVKIAEAVLARFRSERLFLACHHPTSALLITLAERILEEPALSALLGERAVLEAQAPIAEYLRSHEPFGGEEVPIHPHVARHFGLEWWRPDLTYRLDGRDFTFESWIDSYMSEPLP